MTNLELEKVENLADSIGLKEVLRIFKKRSNNLTYAILNYKNSISDSKIISQDEAYYNLADEIGKILLSVNQIIYLLGDDFLNEIAESESFEANSWWERFFNK